MNWKYGVGLTLSILGAILTGSVWFLVFGVPLYGVGVVLIARSEKARKTKLLGIFLPWSIPFLFWALIWMGIIK